MPPRSKALGLKPADKKFLDEYLVAENFSKYKELEAEFRARGYEISKSALHRYGEKFEQELVLLKQAHEEARAVVAVNADETGDMSEALVRVTQAKLMRAAKDIKFDPETTDINQFALMVARITRASIPVKRFQAEAKDRLNKLLDKVEAEAKAAATTDKQASALDMIKQIRERAYGLFDEA